MKLTSFPPSPKEERISFLSSDLLELEGRLFRGEKQQAAIICHPHPLHGGTLQNKVVDAVMRGFATQGITTLRFNFRGVGKSQGTYGNAVEETKDIEGAIRFLQNEMAPASLLLAGFSFGSVVVSRFLNQGGLVDGVLLVAPPLDSMGLETFKVPSNYGAYLTLGSEDEFCSKQSFDSYSQSLGSNTYPFYYEGVGHFFHGHLQKLVELTETMVLRS